MKTRSSQMFPGKGVTIEAYINGQGSTLSYFHRTAGMSAMITTRLARDLLKTDGRLFVLRPEVWRAPPDRWRVCLSMILPAMWLFAYWNEMRNELGERVTVPVVKDTSHVRFPEEPRLVADAILP